MTREALHHSSLPLYNEQTKTTNKRSPIHSIRTHIQGLTHSHTHIHPKSKFHTDTNTFRLYMKTATRIQSSTPQTFSRSTMRWVFMGPSCQWKGNSW